MYYSNVNGSKLSASSVKSLKNSGIILEADPIGLYCFLNLRSILAPRTIFIGMRTVPATEPLKANEIREHNSDIELVVPNLRELFKRVFKNVCLLKNILAIY